MRRRIAVITARADASEQRDILYGIFEAAFDVVVYSNIYNHWQDDNLLNYENIIYSLIEPDLFDGVIVTAEAFRDFCSSYFIDCIVDYFYIPECLACDNNAVK